MATTKIPVKSEHQNASMIDFKPGAFRKLAKNYKVWIADTFHLDIDNNHSKNYSVVPITDIGALFIPIVKYLRLIGFCPLTIRHDPITGFVSYEFKWRSMLTLYNICLSLSFGTFAVVVFFLFTWQNFSLDLKEVLQFQGYDLQYNNSQKMSLVSEIGTRFVPSTFPLISTISVFGTLSSLPNFQLFLNQWSIFQLEYLRTFSGRTGDSFVSLRKFRNETFLIFIAICVLAIVVVMSVIQNFWALNIAGEILPRDGVPKFTAAFTMLIMVGGHCSHFLMFRVLIEAFKQIHEGISMWKRDADRINQSYDCYVNSVQENVKKWSNLVLMAKKQVEWTGKAVALHHVATIFIHFIYLCLGVFSFLSARMGQAEGNRGYILLMFCTWGFSLLTAKAFMCENILEQEKRIAGALRQLDVNDSVPALIRVNVLIDLIIREPSVIRFWNVLTLNKAFLVQLIGQVATYLIVLIQFDNTAY